MIEQASLVIGNDNFAVKENSFLGYAMNQGFYVPREMDVVRATTATLVNSAGLIEVTPYNLLQQSQTFDNATWIKTAATITANASTAPDGTLTADKFIPNTSATNHFINSNSFTSGTNTISVYAKMDGYRYLVILSTTANASFDLMNGVVANNSGSGFVSYSITNAGNGWYRCVLTATSISSIFISGGSSSASAFFNGAGDGTSGILIWGAQVVSGTSAKEYFPTTDRLDVPRVDYSNGTPSILVEPQRTNLALQSSSFDSASWSKVGVTISANTTASPSGVADADKMIENVGSSSKYLSSSSFSANTYTASVYVKPSNKTFFWMSLDSSVTAVFFNLTTGTIAATGSGNTGTIASVGNGWFRCTITRTNVSTQSLLFGTSDSSANYISNGNGVDGVFLWGAQLEAGSNATSYIPTVASTVTRNADVISKTGISSLIGQTEGTIYIDFNNQNLNSTLLCLNKNNTNSLFLTTPGGTSISARAYANSVSISATIGGYTTFNQKIKACFKYGSFGLKLFVNGELKATNTSPIVFTAPLSSLNLNDDVVLNGNSTIRNNGVLVFKTALTDQECINLTTI